MIKLTKLPRAPDRRAHFYASRWAPGHLTLLADTPTSHVWFNGNDRVLKLLTQVGIKDEAAGRIWLEWADGNGSVRLLDWTDDAHLLEYVAGPSAASLADTDACSAICDALGAFPKSDPPPGLMPLKTRFSALTASREIHRHGSSGASIAHLLFESQSDVAALHGDIHHENLMFDGKKWLAIDPKGLVGDRAYDVANTFLNPVGAKERCFDLSRVKLLSHTFSKRLGICENRILCFAYAHACLSACWSIQGGTCPELALTFADMIQPMAQEAADAIFP